MKENLWMWIAWHMPKKLAYWTFIRVGAHATVGEYGHCVVPEVTILEALQRWNK